MITFADGVRLSRSLAAGLVAFAAVGSLAATAMTVVLREDGPALTLEEANASTPTALGDALLAPGHPPVTEATVGPEGMEAPTPPGMPVITRIKLYLQPVPSLQQPDFCQRVIATVYLKPVDRLQDGRLPPSSPADISTEVAYRWIGTGRSALACIASKDNFFVPTPKDAQLAIASVRLLASARQEARRGGRLSFPVSVQDNEGPAILAYVRDRHEPPIPGMTIITNAKKALADLQVDAVRYAGPASGASPDILTKSDVEKSGGSNPLAITIFLGGDWVAGIVADHGQIKRIRLRREIPAPF